VAALLAAALATPSLLWFAVFASAVLTGWWWIEFRQANSYQLP